MVTVMSVSRSSNYKAVPVILRHQTILKPCFLLGRGIVSFSPALCLAGDQCILGMSLGNELGSWWYLCWCQNLSVSLGVGGASRNHHCQTAMLSSPISIPWESFISVHIWSQLSLVLSSWTWNLCWFLF